MGLVTKNDFKKYDGLHANCRTQHLSDEEIQYITWEMNASYYNWEWLRYNKVKRLYPKWFAKEALRLAPFYAKRKAAWLLGCVQDGTSSERIWKAEERCVRE